MTNNFDQTFSDADKPVTAQDGLGANTKNDSNTMNDGGPNDAELSAVDAERDAEISGKKKLKSARRKRTDKSRLHSMRHGILTRHILEALAKRGENIRQLRHIERNLREELKPVGSIGALLFDRMFSSLLRVLLIARTEVHVLTPNNEPAEEMIRFAKSMKLPPPLCEPDQVSFNSMRYLTITQRYDVHHSREFYRAFGALVALRDGGNAALSRQLGKPAAMDLPENVDDLVLHQ